MELAYTRACDLDMPSLGPAVIAIRDLGSWCSLSVERDALTAVGWLTRDSVFDFAVEATSGSIILRHCDNGTVDGRGDSKI